LGPSPSADDLEPVQPREHSSKTVADHRVVVDEQDPHRHRAIIDHATGCSGEEEFLKVGKRSSITGRCARVTLPALHHQPASS
jgi:hypothetical protein